MPDSSNARPAPIDFHVRTWRRDVALTLPFVLLFLVQLAHHQMWRDEINAFGLAIASPDLSTLFHYIHYEGHPWLWYVLLWVVSRISILPAAMQCLQAVIGAAIYLMIGVASPFRTWEKLLLFTCYFISFEYTVMTRMYGVMLLLALIYIRRRALYPARVFGNSILLGLMACTDLTGMVMSFALLLEYALAACQESRGATSFSAAAGDRTRPAVLPATSRAAKFTGALGIYAAFVLSAVISVIPAKDISTSSTSGLLTLAGSLQHLGRVVVSYTVKPYFAEVTGRPGHYWDAAASAHKLLYSACVPIVLVAYWFVLRRRTSLLVLVGVVCLLMISIGQLIYYGSIRHFGMTFIAFLLALWLMRSAGDSVRWPAYVLLAMTSIGGLVMVWGTWQRPFSQEENGAKWIVAHHLENEPIAAELGMGAWLGRPVYMLGCGCVEEFLLFRRGSDYHNISLAQMQGAARYAGGRTFTYIGLEALSDMQVKTLGENGLTVRSLAAFPGAESDYEDVYLYSVTPQPNSEAH